MIRALLGRRSKSEGERKDTGRRRRRSLSLTRKNKKAESLPSILSEEPNVGISAQSHQEGYGYGYNDDKSGLLHDWPTQGMANITPAQSVSPAPLLRQSSLPNMADKEDSTSPLRRNSFRVLRRRFSSNSLSSDDEGEDNDPYEHGGFGNSLIDQEKEHRMAKGRSSSMSQIGTGSKPEQPRRNQPHKHVYSRKWKATLDSVLHKNGTNGSLYKKLLDDDEEESDEDVEALLDPFFQKSASETPQLQLPIPDDGDKKDEEEDNRSISSDRTSATDKYGLQRILDSESESEDELIFSHKRHGGGQAFEGDSSTDDEGSRAAPITRKKSTATSATLDIGKVSNVPPPTLSMSTSPDSQPEGSLLWNLNDNAASESSASSSSSSDGDEDIDASDDEDDDNDEDEKSTSGSVHRKNLDDGSFPTPTRSAEEMEHKLLSLQKPASPSAVVISTQTYHVSAGPSQLLRPPGKPRTTADTIHEATTPEKTALLIPQTHEDDDDRELFSSLVAPDLDSATSYQATSKGLFLERAETGSMETETKRTTQTTQSMEQPASIRSSYVPWKERITSVALVGIGTSQMAAIAWYLPIFWVSQPLLSWRMAVLISSSTLTLICFWIVAQQNWSTAENYDGLFSVIRQPLVMLRRGMKLRRKHRKETAQQKNLQSRILAMQARRQLLERRTSLLRGISETEQEILQRQQHQVAFFTMSALVRAQAQQQRSLQSKRRRRQARLSSNLGVSTSLTLNRGSSWDQTNRKSSPSLVSSIDTESLVSTADSDEMSVGSTKSAKSTKSSTSFSSFHGLRQKSKPLVVNEQTLESLPQQLSQIPGIAVRPYEKQSRHRRAPLANVLRAIFGNPETNHTSQGASPVRRMVHYQRPRLRQEPQAV